MRSVEVHRGGGAGEEELESWEPGEQGAGGAGVAGAAVGRCCSWCRVAGSGSWEVGRVEVGRPDRTLASAGVLEGGRA